MSKRQKGSEREEKKGHREKCLQANPLSRLTVVAFPRTGRQDGIFQSPRLKAIRAFRKGRVLHGVLISERGHSNTAGEPQYISLPLE
jgi:hypothetical protein